MTSVAAFWVAPVPHLIRTIAFYAYTQKAGRTENVRQDEELDFLLSVRGRPISEWCA